MKIKKRKKIRFNSFMILYNNLKLQYNCGKISENTFNQELKKLFDKNKTYKINL